MAAVYYWAGIFGLGFVLGTIRTFWLAPLTGELPAVACELPIMLGASWIWASRLVKRHRIAPDWPALRMGFVAFCLLMLSELSLGIAAFGQTPAQWLAALARPAGTLGLVGQIAFAVMPWLASRKAG